MVNSIPISSLHILTPCFWVSYSFSFLTNSLMLSIYIRWLIFFLRFRIWYFLECWSEITKVYFRLPFFFESYLFSCYLFIRLFCYVLFVPIFCSEIVCFLVIRLLVCLRTFSLYLLVEFIYFLLFWKFLFCLYCFILSRYLFSLPSFASTFLFISSDCILVLLVLLFSFRPKMFQLSTFVLSFLLVVLDFYLHFQSNFPSRFWISVSLL